MIKIGIPKNLSFRKCHESDLSLVIVVTYALSMIVLNMGMQIINKWQHFYIREGT